MSKVFVNIGLSLDGYMAPEGMTMTDVNHMGWGAKWGAMMGWLVNQQYFRENLQLGSGGEPLQHLPPRGVREGVKDVVCGCGLDHSGPSQCSGCSIC